MLCFFSLFFCVLIEDEKVVHKGEEYALCNLIGHINVSSRLFVFLRDAITCKKNSVERVEEVDKEEEEAEKREEVAKGMIVLITRLLTWVMDASETLIERPFQAALIEVSLQTAKLFLSFRILI